MIVIPSIDLMDGKVVRLEQGEAERRTEYSDRPIRMVTDFARSGAKRIHVVDLDGAFAGEPRQFALIGQLSDAAMAHGATIQAGGGIRSAEAVETLLRAGVNYVVVGTLAVREPEVVEQLCKDHAGKIIVAADTRDGLVAVEGWTQGSTLAAGELTEMAAGWGATAVLHTDVTRDGMRKGPAVDETALLQKSVEIPVYASGGVGSLADIDACKAAGLGGVVLGRSLYEEAFTLKEALARC